eukprot:GHVR01079709.1.p1 GENE.GHVR01079709.1~~GHVR01079709.1.p1  ORF type:complete len:453 (+),score=54.16 GHVR01079709.1:1420-2778(+)
MQKAMFEQLWYSTTLQQLSNLTNHFNDLLNINENEMNKIIGLVNVDHIHLELVLKYPTLLVYEYSENTRLTPDQVKAMTHLLSTRHSDSAYFYVLPIMAKHESFVLGALWVAFNASKGYLPVLLVPQNDFDTYSHKMSQLTMKLFDLRALIFSFKRMNPYKPDVGRLTYIRRMLDAAFAARRYVIMSSDSAHALQHSLIDVMRADLLSGENFEPLQELSRILYLFRRKGIAFVSTAEVVFAPNQEYSFAVAPCEYHPGTRIFGNPQTLTNMFSHVIGWGNSEFPEYFYPLTKYDSGSNITTSEVAVVSMLKVIAIVRRTYVDRFITSFCDGLYIKAMNLFSYISKEYPKLFFKGDNRVDDWLISVDDNFINDEKSMITNILSKVSKESESMNYSIPSSPYTTIDKIIEVVNKHLETILTVCGKTSKEKTICVPGKTIEDTVISVPTDTNNTK